MLIIDACVGACLVSRMLFYGAFVSENKRQIIPSSKRLLMVHHTLQKRIEYIKTISKYVVFKNHLYYMRYFITLFVLLKTDYTTVQKYGSPRLHLFDKKNSKQ